MVSQAGRFVSGLRGFFYGNRGPKRRDVETSWKPFPRPGPSSRWAGAGTIPSMLTTHPTSQALLATILADPADDVPRLILADHLDDCGESDRAEFIRVGIEIASLETQAGGGTLVELAGGRYVALRRRELEILSAPAPRTFKHAGETTIVHTTLEDNWLADFLRGVGWQWSGNERVEWRRGFVTSVTCSAAAWLEHGGKIVAVQPVESVTLTGKAPFEVPDVGWMFTVSDDPDCPAWRLPLALWDCLPRNELGKRAQPSPAAALAALSTAAVALARSRDGLPPLRA